jgi:hypothetical protein
MFSRLLLAGLRSHQADISIAMSTELCVIVLAVEGALVGDA